MSVTVNAGDLRQVGTLTNPGTPVPDGDGDFTTGRIPLDPPTWRFAMQRASVQASERIFGNTTVAHARYIFGGRFHPQIGLQTQIVWIDRAGTSHTANVLDVVDTEGAGVETLVLVSEDVSTQ